MLTNADVTFVLSDIGHISQSSGQIPPPSMGVPQSGYAPVGDAPGTYVFEP
jgi:hypothetical protein